MPKVLMPIGDATEVLDTLYPYFRLPEDGFEVVVAGPEARWYHGVMHEVPPDAAILANRVSLLTEKQRLGIDANRTPDRAAP